MKNKFIILLLFFSFINAGVLEDFKEKKYNKVCNRDLIDKTSDKKILSIIGFSCIKTDNLYLLPLIIKKLKYTKIARLNAIYFSTIFFQKRLLYSFFFDNFSLEGFELPNTNYILSIVFNKIKNKEYKKRNNLYIIHHKDKIIKVYKKEDKLFVDEYKQNKLIKRHWYR